MNTIIGLRKESLSFAIVLPALFTFTGVDARLTVASEPPPSATVQPSPKLKSTTPSAGQFECGYRSPQDWLRDFQDAVKRGEIPDPATKRIPQVAPRPAGTPLPPGAVPSCIPTPTANDIFPFEDTNAVLLTNFSFAQLDNLMIDAANALLAAQGDNFDFIGYWLNFTPNHTVGAAFYNGIENDVSGIGETIFNGRSLLGLAGNNIEGFIMMWDINSSFWQPGTGPSADFTRLVLAQEFEHRFGMFLPALADGRPLQGNDGACGRGAHWNFRVDGQGSGMEIAEWIGANPALRQNGSLNFNTDIGGVWSLVDLYLMGYVSPAEMDSMISELRFLDDNTGCTSPYNGTISTFTSADIIETAGERIPSSASAQKHFHTGWVMIHLPGAPPTAAQLDKAAGILAQHTLDWSFSTLGRGTMNNSFLPNCNPLISLRAVDADVPHTIAGSRVLVPEGGARVTLELGLSAWDPNLLGGYSAKIDSTSFTSGDTGSLSLVATPTPSTGAFIDTTRSDYVFTGPTSTSSVDTATADVVFSASVNPADAVADPLSRRYAGTLMLDVSPDATGTFTVSLASGPATAMTDETGTPITSQTLSAASITIIPGNTGCAVAKDIFCDSVLTIDNSNVINPSGPLHTCGIGSSHDGSLWFKFTATNTTARLKTCNSPAQDSTYTIYTGTCGSLAPIGCSEDDGCGFSGFLGDLLVTGLTPGETYYVQFSSFSQADRGIYKLQLNCSVVEPDPLNPDTTVPDLGSGTRNRFLSFQGGTPGRSQSIRITFQNMPPGMEALEGQFMWLAEPIDISENSGVRNPQDAPPGTPTFKAAALRCDPFSTDWSTVGPVKAFGEQIVPDATYAVQLVDAGFENNPLAFSQPLLIRTSTYGDILESCTSTPCTPPDGSTDVVTDVTGILDKFKNLPGSPSKSRSDLEPSLLDGVINISDVTESLNGFSGDPYPFVPPLNPCP